MKEVRGRTIRNETVVLDDTNFIECHLIDCELQYGGGQFGLTHTRSDHCRWTFVGSALRTIEVLRSLNILTGEPGTWTAVPKYPINEA